MRVLCLGGSYTGSHLAREFGPRKPGAHEPGAYESDAHEPGRAAEVTFLARDPERLRADGFRVVDASDLASPGGQRFDLILDTVPTVKVNGAIILPYRAAIAPVMAGGEAPVYLHLSSTSVYPSDFTADEEAGLPTQTEDAPTGPDSDRAKDRLSLEGLVTGTYAEARILRCGGIYGPGRCVATRFRDGDFSRAGSGNRMVTRIHVYDLCRLILAFGASDSAHARTVNAVDEEPSSNRATFGFLEGLLGVNVPGDWRTAAPTGRRVVSKYAAGLLGGTYRFPTFREGFAHCLSA